MPDPTRCLIVNPSLPANEQYIFRQVTDHDRREIEAFSRFLKLGEKAPLPGTNSGFLQRHRGWLPYVLGAFLELRGGAAAPPVGFDDVPITAWTFPA